MEIEQTRALLESVSSGQISVEAAMDHLKSLPYESVDGGRARLDTHRGMRTGESEVVFCPGKDLDLLAEIMQRLASRNGGRAIATRAEQSHFDAISKLCPEAYYHKKARIVTIGSPKPAMRPERYVGVLSAGSADEKVAEEAAFILEWQGTRVERLFDVGVAGLHRLLDRLDVIQNAYVLIVVAGMEGALASVAAGLVSRPVIAVPTSIGYGASLGGIAALLAMLNSCASGVAVVNIDNGFGAAQIAHRIANGE
jgi:NCAIR mutase (PurE)-related protein